MDEVMNYSIPQRNEESRICFSSFSSSFPPPNPPSRLLLPPKPEPKTLSS
jgi:hypothetical protein